MTTLLFKFKEMIARLSPRRKAGCNFSPRRLCHLAVEGEEDASN